MWWKRNPLILIVGMEIGIVTMENIMKVPWKTKIRVAIWSSNLTPGHISGENYNLKRHMHPKVHCTFTIAKTWKQPKNLKVYTYTHTHVHTYTTEYYSAINKNRVMSSASTWVNLEIIILSIVSQTEKDVCYTLCCRLWGRTESDTTEAT